MATLQIERVLEFRFEFELNGGGNIISSDQNRLLTDGDICHFKTGTGANIIKEQNISYADVTVIDTFGATGSHNFVSVVELWDKLIELKFFEGLATAGGGGGGSTTFIGLTDTPSSYFGQDGKIPQVNESQQKVEFVDFSNITNLTDLTDVSITSLVEDKIIGVELVNGVLKFVLIDKPTDGTTYFSAVGGFDYNDLDTATTPLSYTTGDLQLVNDTLGDDTFISQPPYGVTTVWNEVTNTLDFSQLSLGDEVFLRVNIEVTTTASPQISGLKLLLGEGTADEKTLPLDLNIEHTTAGAHEILKDIHFYIGYDNWKNTPAKILFESDASADVKVIGFHPYIVRKSVNILDVEGVAEAPINGNQYVRINGAWQILPSSGSGNKIVSGGMIWVSGLTYESLNLVYEIDGVQFAITDGTQVTLDAVPVGVGDKRLDIIYGDDNGALNFEKGVESATPATPTLEVNQLELNLVLLENGETTPSTTDEILVYAENVGTPTEWDATENTSGVRIDLANTTSPITGTYDIKTLADLQVGDIIEFDYGQEVNVSDFSNIKFNLKLINNIVYDRIRINLKDSSDNRVGTVFIADINIINEGTPYIEIIDGSITTTQNLTIYESDFSFVNGYESFSKITIQPNYNNAAGTPEETLQFQLDDLKLYTDTGAVQPTTYLTEEEADLIYRRLDTNVPFEDLDKPLTAKTTPVDADEMTLWDSADSFTPKKVTWANIKATLKTYFDAIYRFDRLEETNVATTKNVDWTAYEVFKYVMTADTTFSDINLPSTGSKTITLHLSGAYTPTYPAGWDTYVNGTYDGAVLNTIVVQYVKSGTPFYKMQITQPD